MQLIIASNNEHKIKEIKEILSPYFDRIYSAREAGIEFSVEEDRATFLENARKKARTLYEAAIAKAGDPAVVVAAAIAGKSDTSLLGNPDEIAVAADDSGLVVDALYGAPGVKSARYAGEPCDDQKNNQKLLDGMKGKAKRRAKFISAVALVKSDGELWGIGEIEGEILEAPRGAGGFGYDPLFYVPTLGKTFGEASAEEKNSISHRYKALMDVARKLEDKTPPPPLKANPRRF